MSKLDIISIKDWSLINSNFVEIAQMRILRVFPSLQLEKYEIIF